MNKKKIKIARLNKTAIPYKRGVDIQIKRNNQEKIY